VTKDAQKMAHKGVFSPWGKSTGYRGLAHGIYIKALR